MSNKWRPDTVYFCGEYHDGNITEPILVMFSETDIRGNWCEGKTIEISKRKFVLTERESDRKTQMVTYKLKQLADPMPLEL